mmetsp:Transcript_15180/g.57238  ORF Transcript_15180/g.57238 Transcript_15180/m.57238 type:complete len:272 (-) Transcript_15180:277-1092(-)
MVHPPHHVAEPVAQARDAAPVGRPDLASPHRQAGNRTACRCAQGLVGAAVVVGDALGAEQGSLARSAAPVPRPAHVAVVGGGVEGVSTGVQEGAVERVGVPRVRADQQRASGGGARSPCPLAVDDAANAIRVGGQHLRLRLPVLRVPVSQLVPQLERQERLCGIAAHGCCGGQERCGVRDVHRRRGRRATVQPAEAKAERHAGGLGKSQYLAPSLRAQALGARVGIFDVHGTLRRRAELVDDCVRRRAPYAPHRGSETADQRSHASIQVNL